MVSAVRDSTDHCITRCNGQETRGDNPALEFEGGVIAQLVTKYYTERKLGRVLWKDQDNGKWTLNSEESPHVKLTRTGSRELTTYESGLWDHSKQDATSVPQTGRRYIYIYIFIYLYIEMEMRI
jgi:hypothetical protein